MKKIILVAGLLYSGCITGQPKDVFDFEKHFHKNLAKTKTVGWQLLPSKPIFPAEDFYMSLKGNTVRIHRGNMPCVTPDMRQFNMPNIATTWDYHEAYKERYGTTPLKSFFIKP